MNRVRIVLVVLASTSFLGCTGNSGDVVGRWETTHHPVVTGPGADTLNGLSLVLELSGQTRASIAISRVDGSTTHFSGRYRIDPARQEIDFEPSDSLHVRYSLVGDRLSFNFRPGSSTA